ncbi:MAG: phosphoribosylformylglycinamidine cyclo-ligase [Candidatus Omnitrophota bacterium]
MNYKRAGVDIKKADRFVDRIKPIVDKIGGIKGIGGFGGFFGFDVKKYKEPIFVSSTDGVGTKLKIAFLTGKHDTVGIDLVGMNVNDVLCCGARPLFFLDYIATGEIKTDVLVDVVKGIAEGCKQSGCALVGGETAEMPAFYQKGEYDLAGFCTGVVDRSTIIDGSRSKDGDLIIGLASSGPHSNGYSLIRKVFSERELKRHREALLAPTRIYVKPVLSLLAALNKGQVVVKGIAHITGGAFYSKIPRIIPRDKDFIIDKDAWEVPEIFRLIQKKGDIAEKEMFTCFNMGIGMVVVVAREQADAAILHLKKAGVPSCIIGEVRGGRGGVKVV